MLAVDNLFAPRRHDVPHALISAALSLFALKLLTFSAPFLALGYPDIYVIVCHLTFVEWQSNIVSIDIRAEVSGCRMAR